MTEELPRQSQAPGEVFTSTSVIPPARGLAQPLQYSILLQSAQQKESKKKEDTEMCVNQVKNHLQREGMDLSSS